MTVLGEKIYVSQGQEVYNNKYKSLKFSLNPIYYIYYLKNAIAHMISSKMNNFHDIKIEKKNNNITCSSNSVNFTQYSIGLLKDTENVIITFDSIIKDHPDKNIVLYGVSRGCASICHALPTLMKHEKFSNIKAIILEGCFDSFENLFYNRFLNIKFCYYIACFFLKMFTGMLNIINILKNVCEIY
jgi:hypothetical protein